MMYTGNLDMDTTVKMLSIDKMKSSVSEFGDLYHANDKFTWLCYS